MQIATPVRISPAYSDREAVLELVKLHAPYPLMAGMAGYGEMMGADPSPWFRANWALDGKAIDGETEALLFHAPFIAAAQQLFGASVVRPATLIVNLMGPMPAGAAHVDTPSYRGLERGRIPVWLLVTMGASGLFERWAGRVAGAISWFYDRSDGEFEYWPEGRERASRIERAPFGNVAVVADNDRMYHRVGAIGNAEAFAAKHMVSLDSTLQHRDDDVWEVVADGRIEGTLRARDVRISILWKALTFSDERAAREFDEHVDDLDLETVVSTFGADLARRGIRVAEPSDPFRDPEWSRTLTSSYMRDAYR
jgi:hypothetical protein